MAKVVVSEWFQYGMDKPERTYTLIDSIYPPGIMELNGKRYIMPSWYELGPDEDVKREDIKHIQWEPKEKEVKVSSDREYKVLSSKGDKEYIIKADATGSLKCSCPSAMFRPHTDCKHVKEIKLEIMGN